VASYVVAAVAVRLADEGGRVALILLALDRLHRVGTGGVLVACLMVPHVVAAPVVGALTDRARRPCLVVGGLALGFGASLALTAVTLGHLPLGGSLLILLLGGACGPALTGGLSSQLARLTDPDSLPRAFGIDAMTYNIAGVVGPALAGLTAALADPAHACLLLAVLAAVGAVLAAALPVRRDRPVRAAGRPALTAGARAVAGDRTLATVIAASTAGQLGPGAVPVVAALAAEAHHHPSASGLLLSGVAAGGLLGSLLWTARPAPVRRAPTVVMLAMCGTGMPLLAGVVTTALPVLVVAFAVSGLFFGPLVGATFTARTAWAPDEVRAQVFTIGAGLKVTAAAAGAAVVGLLAGVPLPVQFLLVGLNPVVVGLLGLVALGTSGGPTTPVTGDTASGPARPPEPARRRGGPAG
jgi:MFS family permease